MQDTHHIRLEIPSAAEYVSVARRAIEGIATRMNFDSREIGDLKLAVGEACNNAVKHGCPSDSEPCITIVCKVTPGCLEIEVSNPIARGSPCPSVAARPDYDKEGGMGLYIMRKVMDEIHIVWENRIARIRMVKRVKQE